MLAVPSQIGKGVLISPTIYGNVMLGPTAEDLYRQGRHRHLRGRASTFLLEKGRRLMPPLLNEEVTASYAGLRATIDRNDYLIELEPDQRYVLVAGIRSTGLTAAMAIGEYVREQLTGAGILPLVARDDLPDPPRMPNIGERFPRPYQQPDRIAADPEYGRIICFCERVTAGEIRDAFDSAIPPRDLNGLRRRTRAMNGRCQGFFCGAQIDALVEAHARRTLPTSERQQAR